MAWNNLLYSRFRPPCKPDCKNRCASCHGTCDKYIEWQNMKNRVKQDKFNQCGEMISYLRSKKVR